MKNLKYVHVVTKINDAMKNALVEVPRRGGMFNWIFLFNGGEMLELNSLTKEQLEKYDVVQVNMSPADQPLIRRLVKMLKNSSTLLIGNNDYVPECWTQWYQHCDEYEALQDLCDGVFGTEPYQVSCMREGAYVIPHPHWTDLYKHIGNDDLDTKWINVGCLSHWWESQNYIPALLFSRFRRKYEGKLVTNLYGYQHAKDAYGRWTNVSFDKVFNQMSHPDFIRAIMVNRLILEDTGYHTYGRTSVDTAALGVPTVGSNRVWSMRVCFPKMCFDPIDAKKIEECMHKVIKGGSWLDEQMDYARDACDFFDYEHAKKRYLKMYDEVKEKVGK